MSEKITNRRILKHSENMNRLYGEIERYIFAAERTCNQNQNTCALKTECKFWEDSWFPHCILSDLRGTIGDYKNIVKVCKNISDKGKCMCEDPCDHRSMYSENEEHNCKLAYEIIGNRDEYERDEPDRLK